MSLPLVLWLVKRSRAGVHFSYFFRLGRCVSADAAADLAALLDWGSRKTLDAAEAAFLLVTSELLFLPAILDHLLSVDIFESRRRVAYEFVG